MVRQWTIIKCVMRSRARRRMSMRVTGKAMTHVRRVMAMACRIGGLVACLYLPACKQAEIDISELGELSGVFVVRTSGQPFSGRVTGDVSGTLKQGRWHGRVTSFFPDGQAQSEAHFRRGVMHGVNRSWYPGGQLRSESTFVHGDLDGAMRQWWGNGQLKSEKPYAYGQEHGVERSYVSTGGLSFQRSWIRGRQDGFEIHHCASDPSLRVSGSDTGMCSNVTRRARSPLRTGDDGGGFRHVWCFEDGAALPLEPCRQRLIDAGLL